MAKITTKKREELNGAVEELESQLGDNLFACVVYGSAVRGDFAPEAHAAISGIARG